jgi:hypothetical protein
MKTILQILLILQILAQTMGCSEKQPTSPVWDGTTDTAWYNDSQTEFTITTPEQLAGLAKLVNGGNDFKDKTVKLGANIKLKKKTWMPIGVDTYKPFKGNFDGNGFVVSGLYIKGEVEGRGLFGHNEGTIKNLGITDSYVSGEWSIGGLAGFNNGDIDNCYFSGKVRVYTKYGGGLAGQNSGNITSSYSTGEVMGIDVSFLNVDNDHIGGLAGNNEGKITNSHSKSKVVGENYTGGLVGSNYGIIKDSHFSGTVAHSGGDRVGGIAGYNANNGKIINSFSFGRVKKSIL